MGGRRCRSWGLFFYVDCSLGEDVSLVLRVEDVFGSRWVVEDFSRSWDLVSSVLCRDTICTLWVCMYISLDNGG